ncbi:MAG: DUF3313 domain-containing protein [Desulfuromonadales bacterium]|nr:MAG: DUF3313 domain-containing protein [Desulfuromonadales bacterium]
MKRFKTAVAVAICVVLAGMLGGCAVGSYQARSVDLKTMLVNPDILQKGTGDQALYRYVNPKVDLKQYSKVLIDPVMISKDGELDAGERENYQTLANNAYVYLTQELAKDYKVVTAPDPGTFRIQMAIVDADSAKPVRNTLSTLMPIGIGVSLLKYTATGKQSGVGEITSEMKITDAMTGELLGAALDRRVGGKELTQLWSSWHNADDGLKYWAKRLGFALCGMRGGANCVEP